MMNFIKVLAAAAMLSLPVAGISVAKTVVPAQQKSEAKAIEVFETGSNDGVYSLSAKQAAYLGAENAVSIGFFGISLNRDMQKDLSGGAYFDANTFLKSVKEKKGSAQIYAVLNGNNAKLGYTGSFLGPLGTTTLTGITSDYSNSIAVLFGPGKLSLEGGVTFDSQRSKGAYDLVVPSKESPAPVPLLPSLSALAAALGLLAVIGWVLHRRKVDDA